MLSPARRSEDEDYLEEGEDEFEEDVEKILEELTGGRGGDGKEGRRRSGLAGEAEEVGQPWERGRAQRREAEQRYRNKLGQHQALALMLELAYLEKNEGYSGPQIMQACFLLHPAASASRLPSAAVEHGAVRFTGNLGRLVETLRERGFTVKSCGGIPVC